MSNGLIKRFDLLKIKINTVWISLIPHCKLNFFFVGLYSKKCLTHSAGKNAKIKALRKIWPQN